MNKYIIEMLKYIQLTCDSNPDCENCPFILENLDDTVSNGCFFTYGYGVPESWDFEHIKEGT